MTIFSFRLISSDGRARLGKIQTAHGVIDTPAFMPVGTAGTVKAMLPSSVCKTGSQILLGNTYHLMMRPGAETIERLGGLHKFMNWSRPILTDSGGFQIMSLAKLRKLTENGVTFRSHLDGGKRELTPEISIDIQRKLGSDISMQLDECPTHTVEKKIIEASMKLSLRWAQRSRDAFDDRSGYGLFGIVQGGVFADLRENSAKSLINIDFNGYAIGGLAVGEPQEVMFVVLDGLMDFLPREKPRYLMGVGTPADIVGAVSRGVDMFDCVLPTRSGRTGKAFTRRGDVNIRNARHANDPRPIDSHCTCPACNKFSRAYIHHLVKSKEILGSMLMTWHNIHYYQDLMRSLRKNISKGTLNTFIQHFHNERSFGDIEPLQ
ncbi:MAG: tRNA guanosine(34) transglycosylase Tgt [Pseudomonadota bacterium]|nr:tRNA guanosine(34) transglycosylase Tgt [Pseudomonadota bacterium]